MSQIPGVIPEKHEILYCDYGDPLFPSRLHKVPASASWRLILLAVIFGIVAVIYAAIFVAFVVRRNKPPLKERSPSLLLCSAFAGTVALAYMYSRLFFDLILVCPITYYVMEMMLMIFFLPYLLRCYRAIMIWWYNQEKAKILSNTDDRREADNKTGADTKDKKPQQQVSDAFVVKYRWAYSEGFLIGVLIIVSIIWLVIGVAVQLILMGAGGIFQPSCQKQCIQHEGTALKVFLVLCELLILVYLGLVFIMRNMDDDFSIRNELLVLCLFSLVNVAIMIIIVFVPATSWPETPYIGIMFAIELIGAFIVSVVWPLSKSFTRTIYFSDVVAKVTGQPTDGPHEELTDKPEEPTTTSTDQDPTKQPTTTTPPQDNVTTQPKTDDNAPKEPKQPPTNNDTATVVDIAPQETPSNPPETQPTSQPQQPTTQQPAVESKPTSKPVPTAKATQQLTINKDLEEFLTQKNAKDIFKQFLVREFSVENLMFYTEVQYFKKLTDQDEIEETSAQIYDTYVQNGAPFEINVPQPTRNKVEQNIKTKPIPLDAFFDAEKVVYQTMERDSFPRFVKSNAYKTYKASSDGNKPKTQKKPPPKKPVKS